MEDDKWDVRQEIRKVTGFKLKFDNRDVIRLDRYNRGKCWAWFLIDPLNVVPWDMTDNPPMSSDEARADMRTYYKGVHIDYNQLTGFGMSLWWTPHIWVWGGIRNPFTIVHREM